MGCGKKGALANTTTKLGKGVKCIQGSAPWREEGICGAAPREDGVADTGEQVAVLVSFCHCSEP